MIETNFRTYSATELKGALDFIKTVSDNGKYYARTWGSIGKSAEKSSSLSFRMTAEEVQVVEDAEAEEIQLYNIPGNFLNFVLSLINYC